ncbi:MAG: hypothetical protein CMP66_02580 [Flavobacteriales bacterium]|nr:hypothetical protein [Flavobacteriales bacterium]
MKKLLIIILCIPVIGLGQGTLLFSEYGEGSGWNKWIEIYNPTSMNISLDEYRYNFCWNGCDSLQWEFSIPFDSGFVLLPNETYLLVHNNADSVLLDAANQTTNILSNGNDVIGLYHTKLETIVDIIGVLDSTNNITAWDVDGTVNATKDHTMIRKPDVCEGNFGDWSLSDGSNTYSHWIIGVIDDFSDVNNHISECFNSTSIKDVNNIKRNLLEVKDLLGRKTNIINNKAFIYFYDDGTVEKKIIID